MLFNSDGKIRLNRNYVIFRRKSIAKLIVTIEFSCSKRSGTDRDVSEMSNPRETLAYVIRS
jgi:hypothetical protein